MDYDLTIIGSGPGGYVAAVRACQLGLKTAIIEKKDIGGICLNWGCIPTKTIINQAKIFLKCKELENMGIKIDKSGFDFMKVHEKSRISSDRLSKGVNFLLNKNKVEIIKGNAFIIDKNKIQIDNERIVNSKFIIIAAGSRPRDLNNFKFDNDCILSSDDILNLKKLPKSIAVLGAGAIGVEFAFILNSFGVEVHLIEIMDKILPFTDKEISDNISRAFRKSKINIYASTKAVGFKKENDIINLKIDQNGSEKNIIIEKILLSAGRIPNIENLGLENAGVDTENGFIKVYDYYKTNIDNIYAIGDVVNTPQLAHVASKEGEIAVENIKGLENIKKIDINEIPYGVYCEPQVAGFGITEEYALKNNIKFKKSVIPYRAVGKPVCIDELEGAVKILIDLDTEKILGAHIAGADATELIHELLLAKVSGLKISAVAGMIHSHPTLSEILMEASKNFYNEAIHV